MRVVGVGVVGVGVVGVRGHCSDGSDHCRSLREKVAEPDFEPGSVTRKGLHQ